MGYHVHRGKTVTTWASYTFSSSLRASHFKAAPEKYQPVDPENEKKYLFKLNESLRLARSVKGKLFAGMVFYVTAKVPTDKNVLKNVLSAHGGVVSLHHHSRYARRHKANRL